MCCGGSIESLNLVTLDKAPHQGLDLKIKGFLAARGGRRMYEENTGDAGGYEFCD